MTSIRALAIVAIPAASLTFSAASASAQPRAPSPALVALREDHLRRQEAVLGYLAGAAGLSLAAGTALLFTDPPPFAGQPPQLRQSFAAFNLVYGVANTAFVIANIAGLQGQRDRLTSAWLLAEDRRRQARALAMNGGLDMIYITLGLTLWATDRRPIAKGMGLGVALQGALLLGFDGAGALLMSR